LDTLQKKNIYIVYIRLNILLKLYFNYIFISHDFVSSGPFANKLEQDFNRLISIGKLETPSLYIPGYISTKRKSTLGHRQCGIRDPNDKSNFI